jgi:hypothetical protein
VTNQITESLDRIVRDRQRLRLDAAARHRILARRRRPSRRTPSGAGG